MEAFIKEFNANPLVNNHKMRIMNLDLSHKEKALEIAPEQVFISNFPEEWEIDDLEKFVKSKGNFDIFDIYIHENIKQSKGNGIIRFKSRKNALEAIDTLQSIIIPENNQTIYIKELITKDILQKSLEAKYPKHNIFVKNIPLEVESKDKLSDFFSKFGAVKNAKVFTKETGTFDQLGKPILKGKGYGFVRFETQIDAARVQSLPKEKLQWQDQTLEVNFYKMKKKLIMENTESNS